MKPGVVGAVALAALLAAGGGWWFYSQADVGKIPRDALARVQRGDLDIVVAETGRVQPLTKVDIKSKVAGQVFKLRIHEGERVKAGDILLELDPTDFKRRVAQAEADRAMVRAELNGLLAGARREDISEARANLAQAKAHARRADDERNRAAQALTAGSLTPREWDLARGDAAESAAGVNAAQSKLARLLAGSRPAEIEQARARVAKADVSYQSARDELAYSVIRAPIAGTVIHRGIEIGEMVTPGVSETGDREPLLTVADLTKLVVESQINQVDVGKLALGQKATIRVDTLPGEKFAGLVHKVAPAAVVAKDKDMQLFPIKTLVTAGNLTRLKPGMSADLDIFIETRKGVLLLPVEAVVKERDGHGNATVITRAADKSITKVKRAVTLGRSSDSVIEIVGGLNEGDEIFIDPNPAKDNTNQF